MAGKPSQYDLVPEPAGARPDNVTIWSCPKLGPVQYVRTALALLFADRLSSALGHVLDMPPDLHFCTAEFP